MLTSGWLTTSSTVCDAATAVSLVMLHGERVEVVTYALDEVLIDKVPALVQLEQARKGCQRISQGVTVGVEAEVAQLW